VTRALPALVLSLLLLAGGDAFAFHVGKTFGDPPGQGGGGGIFYVGAPLERGWNCAMCHLDAPGRVRLRVDVSPPELFQTFEYVVGQRYDFSVTMWWEGGVELGLGSGRSNFNAVNVVAADAAGIFAGRLQGGLFFSGGDGAIAADTKNDNDTRWDFRWFAPDEPGTGSVTLYFGAVDGNGADSPPDVTRTDPFGDDVFMATVTLGEGAGAGTRRDRRRGEGKPFRAVVRDARGLPTTDAGTSPRPLPAFAAPILVACACLGWRRRRRRR
jgi:hypothetical protein